MHAEAQLLALARAYAGAKDLSLARVATLAHNAGGFFKHLEAGAGCTLKTYRKVLTWFDENWPAGLAWPADVARPSTAGHDRPAVA
jgi:hypothetical protein